MSIEMSESREIPNYPLPGLEPYVKALKNRLYIPEDKSQELQFTNKVRLREWMPEIKIMEDREPVKAKIGSKGVLLSSDMKLPDKIDENTPAEQVVQADALFLAKLEYLREAAPQATSWRRGKTREREVKEQIEDLTSRATSGGGSLEKASVKEILVSLDKKKVAPALATASFVLAACTRASEPVRTPLIGTTEAAEAKMTEQAPYGVEQAMGGVEDEEIYNLEDLVSKDILEKVMESVKVSDIGNGKKGITYQLPWGCNIDADGNASQKLIGRSEELHPEVHDVRIIAVCDLNDESPTYGTAPRKNFKKFSLDSLVEKAQVATEVGKSATREPIKFPEHPASPEPNQKPRAVVDKEENTLWGITNEGLEEAGNYSGNFSGWVDKSSVSWAKPGDEFRYGRWANEGGGGIVEFKKINEGETYGGMFKDKEGNIWRMVDEDYELMGEDDGHFDGWIDEESIPEDEREEGIRWGNWFSKGGRGRVRFEKVELNEA
jgi:hypothetical protein